jgi:hypothetical protein
LSDGVFTRWLYQTEPITVETRVVEETRTA